MVVGSVYFRFNSAIEAFCMAKLGLLVFPSPTSINLLGATTIRFGDVDAKREKTRDNR